MSPLESTLADLIRINSVNSFYADGPGEAELANYVDAYFQRLGVSTWRQEVFPGRENVIACIPGGRKDRRVILEAHMDTVSVTGMTIPPFEPTVENGRMYGRGSCDIKGGMSAMLAAFARLAEEKPASRPTLVMACTVNEEHGYTGATRLAEGWLKPGRSKLLPRTPDAMIVAEPAWSVG